MDLKQVAIVIPFYREELTDFEKIALLQCQKILAEYPKIAVKPRSLNLPAEASALTNLETISFDDEYFKDVWGYNRLMLSDFFYRSFSEYQYVLIYQLDAFVLRDDLKYWCGQGLDYVGAPWVRAKPHSGKFSAYWHQLKNDWYVRNNVSKNGKPRVEQLEDRVGNGGFSLRKVDTFLKYCVECKSLIEKYQKENSSWFHEDIFWSIELNRKEKRLVIPPLETGLQFAFETNPERALLLSYNKLPFGCHAWDKHTDFWRPVFKSMGYMI